LRCGPISNKLLLTLQLTSEESVPRHVSVQMVDTLNTFCEQTYKQFEFFSCVFGSSGVYPSCQLFTVLMLDGRHAYTVLNCKSISLLRTMKEQKSNV